MRVRRTITALLAVVGLALPYADALGAKKPPKKHKPIVKKKPTTTTAPTTTAPPQPVVVVTSGDFTGPVEPASDYGNVQVTITVQKTTTTIGASTTVTRKITAVQAAQMPGDAARSVYISQHALPTLVRLTLEAQSPNLAYMVSGATYTTRAWIDSLTGALALAQQG